MHFIVKTRMGVLFKFITNIEETMHVCVSVTCTCVMGVHTWHSHICHTPDSNWQTAFMCLSISLLQIIMITEGTVGQRQLLSSLTIEAPN